MTARITADQFDALTSDLQDELTTAFLALKDSVVELIETGEREGWDAEKFAEKVDKLFDSGNTTINSDTNG